MNDILMMENAYLSWIVDLKPKASPQLVDFTKSAVSSKKCSDTIFQQVVGKLVLVTWGHHRFTPSLRSSASFAFSASAPAGKKRNPVNPVNSVKITWTERDAA